MHVQVRIPTILDGQLRSGPESHTVVLKRVQWQHISANVIAEVPLNKRLDYFRAPLHNTCCQSILIDLIVLTASEPVQQRLLLLLLTRSGLDTLQ